MRTPTPESRRTSAGVKPAFAPIGHGCRAPVQVGVNRADRQGLADPGAGAGERERESLVDQLRDADRQALHRLAHALCARFDGFAVEDLDVRNLTRSARGTAAEPGVRVAQKRSLNRAIADQG